VPSDPHEKHRLTFGPLAIEFALPPGIETPIGVDYRRLSGRRIFVTLAAITFTRGDWSFAVDAGFHFDGASIPRLFWCVPGFAPLGVHLWATLGHDWMCEHRANFPRPEADARFVTILQDTHVELRHAQWMYLAVRGYAWWAGMGIAT